MEPSLTRKHEPPARISKARCLCGGLLRSPLSLCRRRRSVQMPTPPLEGLHLLVRGATPCVENESAQGNIIASRVALWLLAYVKRHRVNSMKCGLWHSNKNRGIGNKSATAAAVVVPLNYTALLPQCPNRLSNPQAMMALRTAFAFLSLSRSP